GTGICTDTCEPPSRVACTAAEESCNGCDDNRDGATDEGCACATGWVVEHPLAPGPDSLHAVSIAPDGTGFAVGTGGIVLAFDGIRWRRSEFPFTYNLDSVHALAADSAVAVGTAGSVFWWNGTRWGYDDGTGTTWPLNWVFALAEDDVWTVGSNGVVLHYDGSTWTSHDVGVSVHLYKVFAFAPDDVFVGGRTGFVGHWNGSTWTRVSPTTADWFGLDVDGLWGPEPNTLYVAASGGAIYRWDRAEETWEAMPTPTIMDLTGLWGGGPDDVWAVSGWLNGGVVLHYDGTAWAEDVSAPRFDRSGPQMVWVDAAGDAWVPGRDGGVMRRSGGLWRLMSGAATLSIRDVWGTSPQEVFGLGTATSPAGRRTTGIVELVDGAWDLPHWLGGTVDVDGRSVWGTGDELFVVAGQETVRHFDGTTWATLPTGFVNLQLLGIWGIDRNTVFAVGGYSNPGGNALAFVGGPGGWVPLAPEPALPDVDLRAVHGVGADDWLAVGDGGAAVRRRPGEHVMDVLSTGTTEVLRDVWMVSATEAFAVGDNGTILHWDGTDWTSMTAPADPWVGLRLNAVWASAPDNVLVAGESGTLLRHDGSAWTLVPVEVMEDLTGVWGSPANNVFVAADDGTGQILHRCGAAW
ncbi:MAG: hypothetical protein JXB32_14635, partial [Deltaproteobacteria bacterium]|nr:hypothetical protein [Deltaproteobacteria bacterium]